MFPGVYLHPELATNLRWKVLALSRWQPDAVVCGAAAAALTYAPDAGADLVEAALRTEVRAPGFRFVRRTIDPDLIAQVAGIRVTVPALTALDMALVEGADAIDDVLRAGAADLGALWTAMRNCAGRRGNRELARLLHDSRDQPWSAAERLLHRLLRAAGVVGWRANHPVRIAGRRYYLDVAFPAIRLAIEVDGRQHDLPDAFEYDRARHNDLVHAGWTVIHLTWRMINDDPADVIARIRALHRRLARAVASHAVA
jgi:very-short-patch-repair endonuclease